MTEPSSDDASAVAALRRHAFAALLEHRAPTTAEIARASGIPESRIQRAIQLLDDQGAIELDTEARVVGAHGLTQTKARHTIAAATETWNTWCALDAVGIPVALGLDANVRTECPTCGVSIRVVVRQGHATAASETIAWLPQGPCAHLMADFCGAANLFCDREHLGVWRRQAGDPAGEVISLDQVEQLGRDWWNDAAAPT